MPYFSVRLVGTAPVWRDVVVEAPDARTALRDVHDLYEGSIADETDQWEMCEGGNGIDDWTPSGDVWAHDPEINCDTEQLIEDWQDQ